MSLARDSTRARCSRGSEQVTSTTICGTPASPATARHAARVTPSAFTESATTAEPGRRLSTATR